MSEDYIPAFNGGIFFPMTNPNNDSVHPETDGDLSVIFDQQESAQLSVPSNESTRGDVTPFSISHNRAAANTFIKKRHARIRKHVMEMEAACSSEGATGFFYFKPNQGEAIVLHTQNIRPEEIPGLVEPLLKYQ